MLVPELLPLEPLELGEVAAGELLLEPEELGELELDEPLPEAPEDELPLAPDDEPEEPLVPPLELLEPKCLSHSEREIWPSLLLSTEVKLGAELLELALGELLEPPAALEELPMLPDELPLVADGEDDELLPCLEESAAAAARDTAKSAAAVVTVTVLSMTTPL